MRRSLAAVRWMSSASPSAAQPAAAAAAMAAAPSAPAAAAAPMPKIPATSKKRMKHMDPSYLTAFDSETFVEGQCLVRCEARKYDWTATAKAFRGQNDWSLVLDKEEFLLAKHERTNAEMFVFPYGVSVLWTRTKEEERGLVEGGALPEFAAQGRHVAEEEDWEFRSGEKDSILVDEIIFDRKINPLAAKLAASTGLAQELKLSVFEEQVEAAVDLMEGIPEHMATHGQIKYSRKQINRQYGELMRVRTSISLHSGILDLPEFFFELPEGQETYTVVSTYLQTARRARILNERLDLLSHLYTMLSDDRSKNVSHRLEWLIVVLIAAEIGVALVKH